MVIDVIDMEDSVLGSDRKKQLDDAGANSVKILLYGMCNGVAQMIVEIARNATPHSLDALRIWSHGRPGGQTISGGHGGEEYRVAHWTGISVANIEVLTPTLRGLNPYLGPGSHVELRGCEVGQGAIGEQLLLRLASIWRVPVQAGTVLQYHAKWDGDIVEATPSGGLRCTMGSPI